MTDTSPDAAAVAREAILRTPPVDRLRRALADSETMRELALSRLRLRYPERSTLELVEVLLGEPVTRGRLTTGRE